MKLPHIKIAGKLSSFNKLEHGEPEFWRITRRERIHVHSWKLFTGNKGFYGVNKVGRRIYRYIVLDLDLFRSGQWIPTGFHELGHHFLHVPQSKLEVYFKKDGENKRHEKEADLFSLIMRIPKKLLLELMHTPFDQMYDEDGNPVWRHTAFTLDELKTRLRLYEKYEI